MDNPDLIVSNLFCVTLCPFWFCNHLDREETAGCFALFVFLVSHDCFVALLCDVVGLSAVCGCGISRSNSLTIFMEKLIGPQRHQRQLSNHFKLCILERIQVSG